MIARIAAILATLTACAPVRSGPIEHTPSSLRYRVELEASLRAMHVSVCGARLPDRLVPIHGVGRDRFVSAELELADGSRAPLRGPDLDLRATGELEAARCAHYEVSLRGGGIDPDAPMGFDDAVYAPTPSWLWAPEPRDVTARYELEMVLPPGARSSAAFPRDPATGAYTFGEAGFDFVTYAVFGDVDLISVPAPGGCIEVAAVHGGPSPASLERWITRAADAASRALGRLPTESVSVIVLPIGSREGHGDPLAFGMAAHGERASLLTYAWSNATDEDLSHDWVAVHELSHLGHAFLGGESAWLTEGIATYYETILRARAGWVSAETALEQLDGGFRRGERGGTGRPLRRESADRHRTGAYDRVYWAGAAIALSIDVALRAEGSSLDAALERAYPLHRAALTDRELLLAMDGGAPGTATAVAEQWVESDAFPDLSGAYAALGVERNGGSLSFTEAGRALRDGLLNASPALASNPPDCRF